jgi:Protein of unknown function (DUF3261)
MRKRLAALWLILAAIGSGVLATRLRYGLPLAASLVLGGCSFLPSPETLMLSSEAPAASSTTSLVSDVLLAPGHKLVLPQPATFGSRIKVRQLVTIEFAGTSMSLEVVLNIQPSAFDLVAVDPLGRRALTLNWDGTKLVSEKASFLPDSVRPENLLADLIAVYWPAPVVQQALAATDAKVQDDGHHRVIAAGDAELLTADYAWTSKSGLAGTMKYANLSWGYTVSVKSLEVKR